MKNSKKQIEAITEEDKPINNGSIENQLPEGVDEEPRNEEEMHLGYIKHSAALVDVYLAVSDDDGKLLDDPIEAEVTSFINEYSSKTANEIERSAVVLSHLRSLYLTYGAKIDRTESIADGIVTKYRIRQGMLLIIEQKLLQKKGKQWIEHYEATYKAKTLRSAQDYMALARIPKIIPYAFLGKERLMEISRSIKALGIEGDDPMAAIVINPEINQPEETIADLKVNIDYAVALTKINKVEQQKSVELKVNPDLVKRLIENGTKVSNGLIDDLFIIKKENENVNEHLESLCSGNGTGNNMLPQIKKVEGFPKLVRDLKETIESVRNNVSFADRVNQRNFEELESCVSELKSILQTGNATK